jgi:hypothetical protein
MTTEWEQGSGSTPGKSVTKGLRVGTPPTLKPDALSYSSLRPPVLALREADDPAVGSQNLRTPAGSSASFGRIARTPIGKVVFAGHAAQSVRGDELCGVETARIIQCPSA